MEKTETELMLEWMKEVSAAFRGLNTILVRALPQHQNQLGFEVFGHMDRMRDIENQLQVRAAKKETS